MFIFILYFADQDEYVRKNVATLIREIAKHTPEVGHKYHFSVLSTRFLVSFPLSALNFH